MRSSSVGTSQTPGAPRYSTAYAAASQDACDVDSDIAVGIWRRWVLCWEWSNGIRRLRRCHIYIRARPVAHAARQPEHSTQQNEALTAGRLLDRGSRVDSEMANSTMLAYSWTNEVAKIPTNRQYYLRSRI